MKSYKLVKQYEGSSAELGEVVYLSQFGEYCPNNSLRGYKPEEIENNPNWQEVTPDSKEGLHTQEANIKRQMIEAAKSYASVSEGNVTLNDPDKYKTFRAGQDSGYSIAVNERKALLYSHRELFDIVKGLSVIFYKELQTKKMPDGITEMYPLIKAAVNNAKNI